MRESLSKMERLIKEFKRKYRVNGVKNFNKYRHNHAVRNLEAQKYIEKYLNGGYDPLKFSKNGIKTAKDNIKNLVGQNQQPARVTYIKD